MTVTFSPDGYNGACCLCGLAQYFRRAAYAIRDTYRCSQCDASLHEREQARALLDCFSALQAKALADLVRAPGFRDSRIYEPADSGPFGKLLGALPYYQRSRYPLPQASLAAGLALEAEDPPLAYADASFDIVLTSNLLEKVKQPSRALAEIARVLRPGGLHVLTIPCQDALRDDLDDGARAGQPGPGSQSAPGMAPFRGCGADIVELVQRAGFVTSVRRAATASPVANAAVTLVCSRMAL
jgi:SAM-dependent methyltransferase